MTNENTTYNGWTNWETWNFNLWFDGAFNDDAQRIADRSDDKDEAIEALADYIEQYADEVLEAPTTGFLADACMSAMQRINYREIASHYINECDVPEAWNEETAA